MKEETQRRSNIMRAVKSKNTAPEIFIRRLLWSLGYRYRLHVQNLPGKPDIAFLGKKKAIFIHGCFWHGHTCKRGNRIPSNNQTYWVKKITRNKERDVQSTEKLISLGWSIHTIWECELKDVNSLKEKIHVFLK